MHSPSRSVVGTCLAVGLLTFLVAVCWERRGPALPTGRSVGSPPALSGSESALAGNTTGPGGLLSMAGAGKRSPGTSGLPTGASAVGANGPGNGDAFAVFDAWVASRRGPAGAGGPGAGELEEGLRRARERRAALRDLITKDPRGALARALPWGVRAGLPAEIAAELEEPVAARGRLEVWCAQALPGRAGAAPGGNRMGPGWYRTFLTGDRVYRAFVSGRRLGQMSAGGVALQGIAIDDLLAVGEETARVLEADEAAAAIAGGRLPAGTVCALTGEPLDPGQPGKGVPVLLQHGDQLLALASADGIGELGRRLAATEPGFRSATEPPVFPQWSHGTKRLLYMRARFPDDLREPISEAEAAEAMRVANEYFVEVSFHNASIFSTIGPLVMLPQPKLYYAIKGPGALQADARAATRTAGIEPDAFDLDVVRFESVPGFDWAGLGSVGGRGVWLQSSAPGVVCHELGHNFGLGHANFWNTVRPEPPANPQNLPFDADSLVGLDSVIGPGDDVEYGDPFDVMGSGGGAAAHLTALHKYLLGWLPEAGLRTVTTSGVYRLQAHDLGVTGGGLPQALRVRKDAERYYWLSARAARPDNAWLSAGIELHWNNWHQAIASCQLLDTTPGSAPGRGDAALTLGRTLVDDGAQVFLTPLARGEGRVGGRAVPYYDVAVNFGPFPGNGAPLLELSASSVAVAPGEPVEFEASAADVDGDLVAYAWDFGDGRTGVNESAVSVAWNAPGDYVVRCEVSDLRGGVASRHVAVRVGGAGTLRISGQVVDQAGQPLGGVRIHNGLAGTNSPYAPEYRWTYTDTEGRYTLTGLAPGSYEVGAVLDGYLVRPLNFVRPLVLDQFTGVGVDFVAVALPRATVEPVQPGSETGPRPAVFRIARTGATNEPLRVYFRTAGTAATNDDYTAWSPVEVQTNVVPTALDPVNQTLAYGYVDLGPGVRSTNVSLAIRSDTAAEGDETLALSLVYPVTRTVMTETETNIFDIPGWEVRGENGRDAWYQTRPLYHLGYPAEAVATVTDATSPGATTISVTALERAVSENAGDSATFLVSRTGRVPTGTLRIPVSLGGTAVPGDDYAAPEAILVLPADREAVRLTVEVFDDRFVEGNETLTLLLGTGTGYVLGARSAGVTIVDNDLPLVAVTATDPVVDEAGGGEARVTFQRSGDLGQPLEIDYLLAGSAVPGVDYAALPGRITIPAGASSIAVRIVPLDDADQEGDETVEVRLGDSPVYNPVTASRAVVVVRDDEHPTVTVEAVDDRAIEGDDTGTFLFRRAGLATEAITVRYRFAGSAVHQADFVASGDRLTIPAGQRQAVLTVTPIDDALREDAETIALELVPDPAYTVGTPSRAAVILEDNGDTTPAAGFALLASQASESRTNPELAVRISGNPESGDLNAVTVLYEVLGGSATPGEDYVLTNGALVFPFADPESDTPLTNRVAFIPLQVIDDLRVESDETILVRLRIGPTILPSEDTNQPPQVQTNGVTDVYAVHTFTILDDDRSVVSVAAAPGAASTVEGSVEPARFVISRTGATNRAQSVSFHLSGLAAAGSDYVPVPTAIEFAPGQTSRPVAIVPVDDPTMEYREDVVLTLMSAPGARFGAGRQASVSIDDNDGTIEFTAARWQAREDAAEAVIRVRRRGDTNLAASVVFAAVPGTALPALVGTNGVVGGGDFFVTNGVLTFAPGEVLREFSVALRNDDVIEPAKTVELSLVRGSGLFPLGGQNTAVLELLDDDGLLTTGTNVVAGIETDVVVVVPLERTGPVDQAVTVHFATADLTAVAGEDYEAIEGTVEFPAGERSAAIQVPLRNDFVIEGDELFQVGLSTVDGQPLGDVTVTLVDDDCAVEFASATAGIDEDGGVVELLVRRVGATLKPVAVDFVTRPGTALAGSDFEAASGTLEFKGNRFEALTNGTGEVVFLAGETNQIVTVRILNDAEGEPDETFSVALANPRPAVPQLKIPFVSAGSVTQAVVTLRDNEAPGRVDDQFQPGLGADAPVRALALQADGKALVGGDFDTFDGIVLPRLARLHADGIVDRSFNPGRGFDGSVLAVAEVAEGRILAGGTFTRVDGAELAHLARLEPDGTRVTGFDAALDGPVRALLPVPAGVTNATAGAVYVGGDFTHAGEELRGGVVRLTPEGRVDLRFQPGNAAAGTRSVRGLALAPGAGGERLLVAGKFADWADTGARNLVRLLPDGTPDRDFAAAAGAPNGPVEAVAVAADGSVYLAGSFTEVGGWPRAGVARLLAAGGVDAAFDPGSGAGAGAPVLAAGLQSAGRVVFAGAFETFDDSPAGRFVRLGADGRSDAAFFRGLGANATVRALVVQVDGAFLVGGDFTEINGHPRGRVARLHADEKFAEGFIEFSSAVFEAAETDAEVAITVRRTGAAKAAARVRYVTADVTARAGADYEAAAGELEFAAGETNRVFRVRLHDDRLAEGSETLALGLTDAVGAVLGRQAAAVLVLADDESAVAFERSAVEVAENAGGVTLAIRRSGSLSGAAIVGWRTEGGEAVAGEDFMARSGQAEFAPGVAVVSVTIPVLDDAIIEGPETFRVVVEAVAGGLPVGSQEVVTVTVVDDDQPPTHYSLTIEPSPGGTVLPGGGRFPTNTVVRLDALPDRGWEFVRWEGTRVSPDNPLSLLMDRSHVLAARFRPRDYLETFETGDLSALPWRSTGQSAWSVTNDTASSGTYSARSGIVGDGGESLLVLEQESPAGGGSFDFRTATEAGWDFLEFHLNGVRVERWSGVNGWQTFRFNVPAGRNRLEWRFRRDRTFAGALDSVWIDNLDLPEDVDAATPARITWAGGAAGCVVRVEGASGHVHVLEASADLRTWVSVARGVGTGAPLLLADPGCGGEAVRFYRVRTE